ncbi:MAG: aspartate aminotransferase family protein [Gemmatimonadota bacterium]|nr:aspartate aminotransferase family protein [Gemmatimonadota bacterium]
MTQASESGIGTLPDACGCGGASGGSNCAPSGEGEREQVLSDHEKYVFSSIRPYYEEPIVADEGQGVYLRDINGREYLDFFAGILTTSVGHSHPEVVERVREQVGRLGHTSTLYLTEQHGTAAKKLAGIAPGGLTKTFFTNSGSEAIETAIMAARHYTGRDEVVALRYGYSGRGAMGAALTAQASWRPLTTGVTGVVHAMGPYPYRSPFGELPEEELAERFAADLEEVILTTTSGRPAALLAETIQGVAGCILPPRGYFQRAAEIIRRYGGVLIIDEVQSGFGRTGNHWFGIEHWGVEPDIMVMAKGIASGYPVGATIARAEIADAWRGKTISTFGGNAISMAAMNATLDVMIREDVPARSAVRGAQLRAGLDRLAERYHWIGNVRGLGLMQGMELVEDRASKEPSPRRATALLEACREEGLLVGLGGLRGQVMRFGPSMLVTREEVDEALARLGRACEVVEAKG